MASRTRGSYAYVIGQKDYVTVPNISTTVALGFGLVLTPRRTGVVLVSSFSYVSTADGNGVDGQVFLNYGTTFPSPALGDPVSGIPASRVHTSTGNSTIISYVTTFILVEGLTLGVPVWFDVAARAFSGTAAMGFIHPTLTAWEIG